jgi:hypothetical protein
MTWHGLVISTRVDDLYKIAHVTLSGHRGSPGVAMLTVRMDEVVNFFVDREVDLDIKLR